MIKEVERIFKGETYSKAVIQGVGYARARAEEDGYEVSVGHSPGGAITVFFTDSELKEARDRRKPTKSKWKKRKK